MVQDTIPNYGWSAVGGLTMGEHLPVNEIDRIEGHEYVIEQCTICLGRHRHGGNPRQLDVGDTTVRVLTAQDTELHIG